MARRQSDYHTDLPVQMRNPAVASNSAAAVSSAASAPLSVPLCSITDASDARYKVFISHAGEDKVTIALPLRKKLQKRGITAFVDMEDMRVGTEAEPAMIHAMETASVGVFVMSPEFVAREWPMKELMCFLRRRDECKAAGVDGPTIIPFFHRLSISELFDEPRLDRNDKDDKKLYEVSRFYDRQRKGEPEANIAGIKAALTRLRGTMGLENFVNADNGSSYNMSVKRTMMLDMLCKKICEALPESAVESTGTVHGGEVENDRFRAHFDIAYDVSELVFDFERKDSNGDICTQEGKILEMLLDVSKNRNRAIAVRGIGGVGKTSLLRKMRSLKKVSDRFRDGLYCMELGKDATREGLKEALIRAVSKSGGKWTAKQMRTKMDMREFMEGFRSWFASKQCLFVIDDVWDTKEVTRGIIRDLWNVHASGRDSKTLLTTRSKEITADGKAYFFLEPRKPLEAESRAILYHYAGLKPEEGEDEDNEAVEEVLERCAGLPLFLGVAGKGVKTLSFRRNHTACLAYRVYADQLKTSMGDMVNTGIGSHAGLSAGLNISIELVEERKKRFEFDVGVTMAEMHRRLSVMKKQMQVPMMMLKQLWEVENESEAARIAKEFEQVGLADVEYEKRECGFVEVLRLHDSVYEFAVYETKGEKEEGVGHKTVLEGYGKRLKKNGREGAVREWWNKELEDDGYLHRNVCRHLIGAGREKELYELLLSPEWFERQVELNGVMFFEADLAVGIEALEKRTDKAGNGEGVEIEAALEMIREAITLSLSFGLENGSELWFQVHGRLKRAGDYNEVVREYVRRIEGRGPKPRVLCMNGFLMEAGGPNTRIIHVGGEVSCMVLLKDGERVACGCSGGDIAIVNISRSEIEARWRAHDDDVRAIDVGKDGTRIVSASDDKIGKVWDVQSGLCVASFDGKGDSVEFVKLTQDGKRVVSGCVDGSVEFWDIESGLRVGGSTIVDGMKCLMVFKDEEHFVMGGEDGELEIWNVTTNAKVGAFVHGHMDVVDCVTMTVDESRLVSGSKDGTVRLWDVETRQQVENSFKGHTDRVTCVAASSDGRRIGAGSLDGTIRIWDAKSGEQIGDPLIGHTDWIPRVSFLEQEDTIVSCSYVGTVRLWNLKRKKKGKAVTKLSRPVTGVSFSLNKMFVMSGSSDGTLQMWNAFSGETVGEPLREQNCDSVNGVTVTPNGRFVLSVSDDEVVRMWDLRRRKVVRRFAGHTERVWCVAVTPNGEHAVTGSDDGTVRVWDLKSKDGSHFVFDGHDADVGSVFVSDDGRRIISVDGHSEIVVWDIDAQVETKRAWKQNAWFMSRRNLLSAAGESTVHDESGLQIRLYSNQIVHGEGSEAVVLGTLDTTINDWDISPDKRTICVALEDGNVGFLKLEL